MPLTLTPLAGTVVSRSQRSLAYAMVPALLLASCAPEHFSIIDPYQHTLDAHHNIGPHVERFFIDVNSDGVDEAFVGCTANWGTGGNIYHIYEQREANWRCLGSIPIRSMKLLDSEVRGYHDLQVWWRIGGGETDCHGHITTYRWDGREYQAVEKTSGFVKDLIAIDDQTNTFADPDAWHPKAFERCHDYAGGNRDWR